MREIKNSTKLQLEYIKRRNHLGYLVCEDSIKMNLRETRSKDDLRGIGSKDINISHFSQKGIS